MFGCLQAPDGKKMDRATSPHVNGIAGRLRAGTTYISKGFAVCISHRPNIPSV